MGTQQAARSRRQMACVLCLAVASTATIVAFADWRRRIAYRNHDQREFAALMVLYQDVERIATSSVRSAPSKWNTAEDVVDAGSVWGVLAAEGLSRGTCPTCGGVILFNPDIELWRDATKKPMEIAVVCLKRDQVGFRALRFDTKPVELEQTELPSWFRP